jgi:hypothetical protein
MSTAQLSPGTIVDGKFTIGAATWARAGAQGYAATTDQGQPVVLTAYAPACFSSGLVLERSLRELRQLQALQSPRVAAVLACGKLPDGGIYEVVASLPDARLDTIVARGPMSGPEAAGVIEQVGEGLLEAQKAGVIHRNLGPRVVFVGPEGAVITGLCVGEPHGDKSFGPLDTIAPEQVEGKVVDQRTLIYNLAALMHMLITGAPLFPGDPAAQLESHLRAEVPADVHARLKRALVKDPRMRPMMLKQFLSELRAIGGAAARAPMMPAGGGGKAPPVPGGELSTPKPAGGAPSSRGWTMFMQDDAPAGAAPAAAPAAAASASPADVPAKPKTRGWTMFMEGAEEPPKDAVADKPAGGAPSSRGWTMFMEDEAQGAQSEAAAPAQAPAPAADGSQPKTRGWTMFMEDEAQGAQPATEAAAASPAQAPAPAADGSQPKTRGWTMFMEDEAPPAAVAADPAPTPTSAVAPAPAPAAGGPAAKPSTRGWTMFMEADEEAAAAAVAAAEPAAQAVPAVAPPAAAGAAAAPATPKSSGWTMFTDAADVDAAPEAAAAAAESPAPADVEAPAPAGDKPKRGDADAPSKKRGWTMFMEKPLNDAKDPLGGVAPNAGESNAKGWTVFSPAADVQANAAPEGQPPGESLPPRESPSPQPAASGHATVAAGHDEAQAQAQAQAESDRLRAKTLVVTGPPDAAALAQPQTVVAPAPAEPPQRMSTVVSGEPPVAAPPVAVDPGPASGAMASLSGPPSGAMSGPMSGPVTGGLSGPVSTGIPRQPDPHAVTPAKGSSPVPIIVVGVVVVIVLVVGAIMMFG